MNSSESKIVISYFSDGYGPEPKSPCLLVGITNENLLEKFSNMICGLADNDKFFCLLSLEEWIILENIDEVIFANSISEYNHQRKISEIDSPHLDSGKDKVANVFLTRTGWSVALEMMKSLRPGTHQYIEGDSDLLVICSYKECRSH